VSLNSHTEGHRRTASKTDRKTVEQTRQERGSSLILRGKEGIVLQHPDALACREAESDKRIQNKAEIKEERDSRETARGT